MHHDAGRTIVSSLPVLLPSLEVLDLTRCPWATESLLGRMMAGYYRFRKDGSNNEYENDDGRNTAAAREGRRGQAMPSSLAGVELPTVYYCRGRFEWRQPEETTDAVANGAEIDPWEDDGDGAVVFP